MCTSIAAGIYDLEKCRLTRMAIRNVGFKSLSLLLWDEVVYMNLWPRKEVHNKTQFSDERLAGVSKIEKIVKLMSSYHVIYFIWYLFIKLRPKDNEISEIILLKEITFDLNIVTNQYSTNLHTFKRISTICRRFETKTTKLLKIMKWLLKCLGN